MHACFADSPSASRTMAAAVLRQQSRRVAERRGKARSTTGVCSVHVSGARRAPAAVLKRLHPLVLPKQLQLRNEEAIKVTFRMFEQQNYHVSTQMKLHRPCCSNRLRPSIGGPESPGARSHLRAAAALLELTDRWPRLARQQLPACSAQDIRSERSGSAKRRPMTWSTAVCF